MDHHHLMIRVSLHAVVHYAWLLSIIRVRRYNAPITTYPVIILRFTHV